MCLCQYVHTSTHVYPVARVLSGYSSSVVDAPNWASSAILSFHCTFSSRTFILLRAASCSPSVSPWPGTGLSVRPRYSNMLWRCMRERLFLPRTYIGMERRQTPIWFGDRGLLVKQATFHSSFFFVEVSINRSGDGPGCGIAKILTYQYCLPELIPQS